MFLDFVLASLHHLAAFVLVALIVAEMVLLRPNLDATAVARLARFDLLVGIVAGLMVVFGFARVFFGIKGASYYWANHVFWTKFGLFVIIALISIVPTMRFIAWRKRLAADPTALPTQQEIRVAKLYIHVEATLVLLLPILGAAMARGYGMR